MPKVEAPESDEEVGGGEEERRAGGAGGAGGAGAEAGEGPGMAGYGWPGEQVLEDESLQYRVQGSFTHHR